MFQSRLEKLRKLESKARESLGNLGFDGRIELEALTLDAQITAFRMVCRVHAQQGFKPYGTSAERMRTAHQRFVLSEPLAIKERFTELRQLVEEHGAPPEVRAVLARARDFLNGAA